MGTARARTDIDPGGRRSDAQARGGRARRAGPDDRAGAGPARTGPASPWWHHVLGLWLPLLALTVLTVVLLASR